MSFVGHWEMDGVKPKAGLCPPVADCEPGHTMPSQWAVPVCLVMDYDPQSCWRGEEGWLFASCCPGWNRLFPLSYPPLDSELLKWYLATSNWHPKTNWQICFLSLTAGIFVLFVAPSFRDCATATSQSSQSVSLALCASDISVTLEFEKELKTKEHVTYTFFYCLC